MLSVDSEVLNVHALRVAIACYGSVFRQSNVSCVGAGAQGGHRAP